MPVRRPDGSLLAISVSAYAIDSSFQSTAEVYLPALQRTAQELERLLKLPQ